ncbi:MAG: hypothetical protein JRC60_08520, partial [Deltaproteobacteria bacterium]|nr:hypothetical protein [Deltaproteobacteria bacterium]
MEKILYELTNRESDTVAMEDRKYRKELIRAGEWVHPQAPNMKFKVTLDRMKEWLKNFKKGLFKVFIPKRHSENPDDNTGWVEDLQIEGKKLYGVLNVQDEETAQKIDAGTIQDVSISIDPNYEDSHGR